MVQGRSTYFNFKVIILRDLCGTIKGFRIGNQIYSY
jgi:hypothetical protein